MDIKVTPVIKVKSFKPFDLTIRINSFKELKQLIDELKIATPIEGRDFPITPLRDGIEITLRTEYEKQK